MSETLHPHIVEAMARAIAVQHGVDPDQEGPGQRHVVNIDGIDSIITDHMGPLWRMSVPDAEAALRAALPLLLAEMMEDEPSRETGRFLRAHFATRYGITLEE